MSATAHDQLRDHNQVVEDSAVLLPQLRAVGDLLIAAFESGHRLYTLGNGGSAAAAQHLAGELIGRYKRRRRALPAVALTADGAVISCIGNDYSYDDVFARQLEALAGPGDMVIAFTSSGRSPNVVNGLRVARAAGATTVLMTGQGGGPAAAHADHPLVVPHDATARIQEVHELFLHILSEQVDVWAEETESEPARVSIH